MLNQRTPFILASILLFSLAINAQPRQGQPAEEIALPQVNGDTLKLSSFKGKIVLIDFWASWCGPCRAANHELLRVYAKYKEKGFEIYSISLDDNGQAWRKAISRDKIKWKQVTDPGGWEANTARNWEIEALPTNFLMDKDGVLVAKDLEGKDLEKALKVLLEK
jgi:thiol-disulfide isomerase/thioredoxin